MRKILIVTTADIFNENSNGVSKIIFNLISDIKNHKIKVKSFYDIDDKKNTILGILKYFLFFRGTYRDFKVEQAVFCAESYVNDNHYKYDLILFMGPEYHGLCKSLSNDILKKTIFNFIDNNVLFKCKLRDSEKRGIKRIFYNIEIMKLIKAFKSLPKNSNILFVSKRDSMLFNKISGMKSTYIENGVSPTLSIKNKYSLNGVVNVIFHGDITYTPNLKAVDVINEIASKNKGKYNFRVIGKVSDEIIFNNKNIDFLGFVDDLPNALKQNDIYICPVFTGAGIKNKILDAAMVGLPIISTSEAMSGIKLRKGEDYIQANSSQSFIVSLNDLVENDLLRQTLGESSRYKIVENYLWVNICKKYEFLFDEIYSNYNS